ncbi:MAG: hypothetical protein L0332_15770 [Chloroflexi bacterium]|nr:hypothetical protein [Chloroflexota bacterium]MCI0575620.1 hypothetical protein [Chloroflexota bacterium]MCI0648628.1 hypothetical protein [Chloroflexota bacterium]MCI0728159.1 hypothetical protein [Chloroflexota bacterium]
MATTQPTRPLALWLNFLSGPLIWSIYFTLGYFLVEIACRQALLSFRVVGLPGTSAAVLVLTLVALLATFYAGYRSYNNLTQRRRLWPAKVHAKVVKNFHMLWGAAADVNSYYYWREEREGVQVALKGRYVEFMAVAGVLLNGLFGLIILLTGIPALVLQPCLLMP